MMMMMVVVVMVMMTMMVMVMVVVVIGMPWCSPAEPPDLNLAGQTGLL